jgi:hypothetical protein
MIQLINLKLKRSIAPSLERWPLIYPINTKHEFIKIEIMWAAAGIGSADSVITFQLLAAALSARKADEETIFPLVNLGQAPS